MDKNKKMNQVASTTYRIFKIAYLVHLKVYVAILLVFSVCAASSGVVGWATGKPYFNNMYEAFKYSKTQGIIALIVVFVVLINNMVVVLSNNMGVKKKAFDIGIESICSLILLLLFDGRLINLLSFDSIKIFGVYTIITFVVMSSTFLFIKRKEIVEKIKYIKNFW